MTLRVEISIVPFGEEENKRVIHTLNISNLGRVEFDNYTYGVELDKYKTEEYNLKVQHNRSDGALVLVEKVLQKLRELR